MNTSFTTKFIRAALAFSLLAGAGSETLAQKSNQLFWAGKTAGQTVQPANGSHAKINALVSRPGNSQDYVADTINSGNWLHLTNSAYTYDTQGRLTQRLYTNPVTNQNLGRQTIAYDAKGNETEYRDEEWNGTSWSMLDGSRTQTNYNVSGQKVEVIYQYWDGFNNVWEKGSREEMAYDANNLMLSTTVSYWDGTAWEPTLRGMMNHTGGVATSMLIQRHNGIGWENASRLQNLTWHKLYEYPLAYEMERFDNNAWIKSEKYAAVYDAKGGHVGTYLSWDGAVWENHSRETESFDANRNYTGWLDEDWNPSTSSWDLEGEDRQVLTYSGIDVTQRIFQDSWPSGIMTDRTKEVYSNFQTFSVTGIKNTLSEASINVFPNPASHIVTITMPENKAAFTATLADVTGKTWLSQTFKAGEETALNIEILPKGVYLLQLQTETGYVVKRIVKQ